MSVLRWSAVLPPRAVSDTQSVGPTGIPTAEAFGTPTVTPGSVTVAPTGIASLGAFGTAKVNLTVFLTGLGSGEAFGSPVVAPGPVSIRPSGLPSGEAVGNPTVALTQGGATIAVAPIYTGEAFGTPAVRVKQTILPAGIRSAATVSTPTVKHQVFFATAPVIPLIGAANENPLHRVQLNRGITYYKVDGIWRSGRGLSADEIDQATELYYGGYEYEVPLSKATELLALGFTIRTEMK